MSGRQQELGAGGDFVDAVTPPAIRADAAPGARPEGLAVQIAEALRLLRTRRGLTQTAASQGEGAPDFRSVSQWETCRKMPSLKLLIGYAPLLALSSSRSSQPSTYLPASISASAALSSSSSPGESANGASSSAARMATCEPSPISGGTSILPSTTCAVISFMTEW